MKDQKPYVTAQRLLNLYRQYHAINGKWAALNPVFLKEGDTPEVQGELELLPTGKNLVKHIKNLQHNLTAKDSIDPDLLPYNGAMEFHANAEKISNSDMAQLAAALKEFMPDAQHLEKIKSLPFVADMGEGWRDTIGGAIAKHPELAAKWELVLKFDSATQLWFKAGRILAEIPSDRSRAEIQADMLGYENFLPLFGASGMELLNRLKETLSTQE
ncbi:MAG: hypothetical protein FWD33_01225 [Alphaproteobacteria bacterium]|nr:hypothetical protein [Alphaproteobacteria bacterium]